MHIYSELFYSNLDESGRNKELRKLGVFLEQNVNVGNLFLITLNPKSKGILINKYDGNIDSLINYVFIRTELAGVGNYNFIIESSENELSVEFKKIINRHLETKLFSSNRFFDNKWAEELVNKSIVDSVLVNYCDGIWVELFRK